jgi:alanyl-tRNA synthetase
MTEKLFYKDPYLREFTAKVIESSQIRGRHAVVLDRTAFYATSGGQPHDTGTLNDAAVQEVVEENGKLWHFVDRPLSGEVKGAIDWERRVEHMQQHHGQHILSEAFIQVARATTSSFHLGKDTCTIDLDRNPSETDIREAQKLANQVIFENRPVTIGWFTLEQVRAMKVRKIDPAIQEPVRIVNVEGFDCQPCSGTHPAATGQVGSVAVLGCEKQKVGARITFVCGVRVVNTLVQQNRILRSLSSKISASLEEIEGAVDRRLAEEQSLRRDLLDKDKLLAKYLAQEIYQKPLCSAVLPGRDIKGLKLIANEVMSKGGAIVALLSTGESGTSFVIGASPEVSIDLRAALKDLMAKNEGKGGGEPRFVQGSFKSTDAASLQSQILKTLG